VLQAARVTITNSDKTRYFINFSSFYSREDTNITAKKQKTLGMTLAYLL
jgi:hypothetical protein